MKRLGSGLLLQTRGAGRLVKPQALVRIHAHATTVAPMTHITQR